MLNTISTVLPFLVCLFWTALFMLDWKDSYPAKHILAIFMGISTVLYFCHALFFSDSIVYLRIANSVYTFCTLAVFPMFYLYILRLTTLSVTFRDTLVLAPAVALGLAATIVNIWYPYDIETHKILVKCVRIVFAIQLLPICYYGYRKLKDFDRKVENLYAETEKRSMKYTRNIILLMLACAIFSAVSNYIGRAYFFENKSSLVIPSSIFSAMLFLIGYYGMKQEFCIDYLETDLDDISKGEELKHQTDSRGAIFHEPNIQSINDLEDLMGVQKLYLNNDIRLIDVARRLGMSRNVLSSLINSNYGVSFSDYINGMRIEYAKTLIREMEQSKTSLLVISEQSGFTSEASFYRAFKKHTGTTPKQWLSSIN